MRPDEHFERLDRAAEQALRGLDVPIRPIGYVRTGYGDPADVPIQTAHNPDGRGLLVLFDEFAAGLADLAGFDYAVLLAYMDRAPDPAAAGDDDAALRPVPFLLRDRGQRIGVFATRYPVRPNRLTLSLVGVEKVDGATVVFTGVDLADGTPIVDVKPWVAGFDVPPGVGLTRPVTCGWYDDLDAGPARTEGPSPIGFSDPSGPLLVETHVPTPRLLVVGTAALSEDIVAQGRVLGWEARGADDAAGALVDVAQLGPRDALVVLDHDVRSTGPVLAAALDGNAGYVGALGSSRTQARRVQYLRELGLTDEQLQRLHGPTGLDLGAANRAETALSICAEIISERTGRSARPLRETTGSITR